MRTFHVDAHAWLVKDRGMDANFILDVMQAIVLITSSFKKIDGHAMTHIAL